MDQSALISQITIRTADQKLVQALFLGGSYGRGTADAYSDVDLIPCRF
ncbi:nucleotidyltransferase domain-containing protein [Rhizobium sullae]